MADKITLLVTAPQPHGAKVRRVLYWYDIAADPGGRIKDFNNLDVVVQQSAGLPPEAAPQVSPADKALIDTGDAGWEMFSVVQTVGETKAQISARLLADHTARQTWWIQNERDRYADAGQGTS
jgi:hypothetical protein